MFLGFKRVVVGDGERALLYKNRRFERVLGPGVTWIVDLLGECQVRVFDLAAAVEYAGKDVDALVQRLGDALRDTFVLADVSADEVGLVSKNGKLEDVLAPGAYAFWNFQKNVSAEVVELRVQSVEGARRHGACAATGAGAAPVPPPAPASLRSVTVAAARDRSC